MKLEHIPVTAMQSFQLGDVSYPSPNGIQTATDLFVHSKSGPTAPVKTSRIRLSRGLLEALAQSLAEASDRDPTKANRIQRLLKGVKLAPVEVNSSTGQQAAFLLTLEQTNNQGGQEGPVKIVMVADQVVAMAGLLQAAISHHRLGEGQAPSTSTRQ